MLHVKGKDMVEFAKTRLEKARAVASILFMEAEVEKRAVLAVLAKIKAAEDAYNAKEQAFEECMLEVGLWRAILSENGVCEYSNAPISRRHLADLF